MADAPRVSCVMPVCNGERYLAAALDSIIAQSRPADEIIVVNDGSTDSTSTILHSYGASIRVVVQKYEGLSSALNTGIRNCSTKYITFCDSDDLLTHDAISVRLAVLENDASLDAVFGTCEQFVSPEVPPEIARRFRFVPQPETSLLAATMIARREAFDRFGLLDEAKRAGGFIDWMSRARSAGLHFTTVDSIVLRRRIHETNMSRETGRDGNRDLLAVVREHHRRQSRRQDDA